MTVRQLLNHTSGLPDYTQSKAFAEQARRHPRGFVSPLTVIGWVRAKPLLFAPGSKYEYSNTDNIVVGLIVEALTGKPYGAALREIVFGPARLRQTSFPTGVALPRPFIHGYLTDPPGPPVDVRPSSARAAPGPRARSSPPPAI